jgi:hypothetical protein
MKGSERCNTYSFEDGGKRLNQEMQAALETGEGKGIILRVYGNLRTNTDIYSLVKSVSWILTTITELSPGVIM